MSKLNLIIQDLETLNTKEDIVDIAFGMQYFKNYSSSSDDIYFYANHSLYNQTYQKLLSFSKEELETTFYDEKTNYHHPNKKVFSQELRWQRNIYDCILTLKNSLFFTALIQKNAFSEKYHPCVSYLLKQKKTPSSLKFCSMLFSIQSHSNRFNNNINEGMIDISNNYFHLFKDLSSEEDNEMFMIFLKSLSKNKEKLSEFICSHLRSFSDEHKTVIFSFLKSKNLNIADFKEYSVLPDDKLDNINGKKFWISGPSMTTMNEMLDFGFTFSHYSYNGKSAISCILEYALDYNSNSELNNTAVAILQKLLLKTDDKQASSFFDELSQSPTKHKKYFDKFEFIIKEKLNQKLHENLIELPKTKQPKI